MNKFILLSLIIFFNLSAFSQEPERVLILNQKSLKKVFIETFDIDDTLDIRASFVVRSKINANGRLASSTITQIDTSNAIYRKRDVFLNNYEKVIKLTIPAGIKRKILANRYRYCISVIISKCAIFDYDDAPFRCP